MSLLSGFPRVGFCGSRRLSAESAPVVEDLVSLCDRASVVTGCARGADALVRAACPVARVFVAREFGSGRRSFAARSAAMVRFVGDDGALVGLVSSPCPDGVVPAPRWVSGSPPSGSWSSLALAAGLGSTVFVVWLAACPAVLPAWPGEWALCSVLAGCSVRCFLPSYVNLSLFDS